MHHSKQSRRPKMVHVDFSFRRAKLWHIATFAVVIIVLVVCHERALSASAVGIKLLDVFGDVIACETFAGIALR